MEEKTLSEEEMNELVESILVADAYDHYSQVLPIWGKYISMVFDEFRTKDRQYNAILASLDEHRAKTKAHAVTVAKEDRTMIPAADIMCVDFVQAVVEKAFGFSTYSAHRRNQYIQKAIMDEVQKATAKVDPIRHILDDMKEDIKK